MTRSVWRLAALFISILSVAAVFRLLTAPHSLHSWLAAGLAVFAWGCVFALASRPVAATPPAVDHRQQAQRTVQVYGRTSMAHLALLDDKQYFFSPGGSLVAYTALKGVAITLGDPIGPVEDADAAIGGFCHFCAQNGWLSAFCLTSADYLDIYRRHGFRSLCLGHEGILDLRQFTLRGNANKTFRKRYNRLAGLGYRVEVLEPPIAEGTLSQLRQISDEWLKMLHTAEKQFFLARFDEAYVRNERMAVVYTPDGLICAFVNLVPEYQLNEISIDLMRRRRHLESGVMDFLFVSLFLWARQQGYDTFNLGLSPLYAVGKRPGPPWIERFLHFAYEHGSFYNFKGLNGFKMKFHPRWEPQYLIYPGIFNLVRVGLVMARVNAGDGESLSQYFRRHPKRELSDDD